MVVLALNAEVDITEKIMCAGADSCITGKIAPERMQSFIEITRTHFKINLELIEENKALNDEIESLRNRSHDQRDIDQAKGLLMQSYRMTEDDACKAMHRIAVETGNKLDQVARNLISMSKVLG